MQSDKGIGIVPMPAWFGMLVYESDVAIGIFIDQRVGKGEANGASANDQIIGFVMGHFEGILCGDSGDENEYAICN